MRPARSDPDSRDFTYNDWIITFGNLYPIGDFIVGTHYHGDGSKYPTPCNRAFDGVYEFTCPECHARINIDTSDDADA